MKKIENKKETASFRYHFSKPILACAIAVFALCIAGIVLTVYRMVKNGVHGFNDVLKFPFLLLICVFCIVLVISILIKSQYVLDDTHFIVQFGFIKNKYPIKDITSVILNSDTKKTTVYLGEENFLVLSIPESLNDDFSKAIRKFNPDVEYSFTLSDKVNKDDTTEE